MAFDWATEGPYEGGTVTFITTYKGYKIYFVTAVGNLYGVVDPDGVESMYWHDSVTLAKAWINDEIGEPTPSGNGATILAGGGIGLLVLLYLIFRGK